MPTYLLDTNMLIMVLRGRTMALDLLDQFRARDSAGISVTIVPKFWQVCGHTRSV